MKSAAALTFLVTRALAEGVRIAAVATVVHIAFGTGGRTSVIVILLVTLVYTWEGGMKAVIWTDVIQTIIYLSGSAAAFFLLLHRIPGGWGEISRWPLRREISYKCGIFTSVLRTPRIRMDSGPV